jgi:predicted dithiol-disulfide oxidoreductase (DUF899 family)
MPELMDAAAVARESARSQPGESAAYREARNRLLAEEIELRRHKERVAEMRRALPEGPEAPDYRFLDAEGREVGLKDMFRGHDTLYTYFWMFGPQRARPCPMCTDHLQGFDATVPNIERRVAYAVLGRSPVSRQLEFARERGWRNLRFYQNVGESFARDHGALDDKGNEWPAQNVWTLRGGKVRRFWADEMSHADPGQDARGALDPSPLWAILDLTPGGRGTDWYPSLDYQARQMTGG